jgi:hypothetical protein
VQQRKQSPDSRDSPQNGGKSLPATQGLISRIYRELKKLSSQSINTPVKKWAQEFNREFSKEEVQVASKYMKCSTSLVIEETQIKTTF